MKRDERPALKRADTLLDTPYIRVYDLVYEDGLHYYDASRRKKERLCAVSPEEVLPDAVSGFVILRYPDGTDRFLLFHEYRYPTGRYVLSIPSGLIDESDRLTEDPVKSAMVRELREETGITAGADDLIRTIDPLVFNSPGMTDESTALVACVISLRDEGVLSQKGAEGSERFAGFCPVTVSEAKQLLKRGKDEKGDPYPLVTWAGLSFFVSEVWKEEQYD